MSKYFVKEEAVLELKIVNCSPATRRALDYAARDSGETLEQFCASAALVILEACEERRTAFLSDEELEEAAAAEAVA